MQPGRNYTGYRNVEAWTRQIEPKTLDAELFKPFNDEPQYIVGVARVDGKMPRWVRKRLMPALTFIEPPRWPTSR